MTIIAPLQQGVDSKTASKAPDVSDGKQSNGVIGKCAPVRITSLNTVAISDGTAADALATVHGICPEGAFASGEDVTVLGPGVLFTWTTAGTLVPGSLYYLAAGGGIDDAPTLGDAVGLFFAASTTALVFKRYSD